MGKDEEESQQGRLPAGSLFIDHPTKMKRQVKFSTSGWQKSHNR